MFTALGLPALPLTDGTNCFEDADEGVEKLVLQGPFEMLKLSWSLRCIKALMLVSVQGQRGHRSC